MTITPPEAGSVSPELRTAADDLRWPTVIGEVPNPEEFTALRGQQLTRRGGYEVQLAYRQRRLRGYYDLFEINGTRPPVKSYRNLLAPLMPTLELIKQHADVDLYGRSTEAVELVLNTNSVEVGEAQRLSGWHRDASKKDELIAYAFADALPTEFFRGDYLTSGVRINDVWGEMKAGKGEIWSANPFEIVRFDGNVLHRSPVAREHTGRVWGRLTFVTKLN